MLNLRLLRSLNGEPPDGLFVRTHIGADVIDRAGALGRAVHIRLAPHVSDDYLSGAKYVKQIDLFGPPNTGSHSHSPGIQPLDNSAPSLSPSPSDKDHRSLCAAALCERPSRC
jgi:hypothetical protein